MATKTNKPEANWLPEQFDFDAGELSEEALVAALAERIGDMLEREPEMLMSLLYRLDVEERKIKPVLRPDAPELPAVGLARLVLARQKQRMETKRSVQTKPLKDMKDWEW